MCKYVKERLSLGNFISNIHIIIYLPIMNVFEDELMIT